MDKIWKVFSSERSDDEQIDTKYNLIEFCILLNNKIKEQ